MASKYYQKYKEKKLVKDIKIFLKKKKQKGKKRSQNDIKLLLKRKKKKGVSIIRNVSRSHLSIE